MTKRCSTKSFIAERDQKFLHGLNIHYFSIYLLTPKAKLFYMVRVWVVRLGDEIAEQCKDKGVIAIGWNKVGDLSSISNKETLRERLFNVYVDKYKKEGSAGVVAGMLWDFAREITNGDIILSPKRDSRILYVGVSENKPYSYDPHLLGGEFPHIRRVSWKATILYNNIPREIWRSMTAWQTLFELSSRDAVTSAQRLAEGVTIESRNVSDKDIRAEVKDFYKNTTETTKDMIVSRFDSFDGYEFQAIVRDTLKAAGLFPKPIKSGRDGGVDIEAYRDQLQLGPDRIVVQVKHRAGPVTGPEMREFRGALNNHDTGLYVSTGGFSPDAKKEAESRQPIVKMYGWEDFINLFLQVYDKLDNETKAQVPLETVYLLHPTEEDSE